MLPADSHERCLRAMVASAAVAIIAVACSPAAVRPSGAGGDGRLATRSPSSTAVFASRASASPAPMRPASSGALAAGSHTSAHFVPSLHFEVPAGWMTIDDDDGYYVLGRDGPDSGAIVLQADPVIASDDRDCEGLAASGGATDVDGIVAALSSDSRLATTHALPVTVGGHDGQAIDIRLAPGWTGTCKWSGGKPAALLLTVADPPGPFMGIGEQERIRLFLLDVGNGVVSIAIDSADGSNFDALVSEAAPIVSSFEFAP